MPYKTPPTKAEVRRQLQRQVEDYLKNGGAVQSVAKGVSGRDANLPVNRVFFDQPKEPRTYVNDVVASIDARRKPASQSKPPLKRRKPQLKTIFDDFGEPLRRIWVDED